VTWPSNHRFNSVTVKCRFMFPVQGCQDWWRWSMDYSKTMADRIGHRCLLIAVKIIYPNVCRAFQAQMCLQKRVFASHIICIKESAFRLCLIVCLISIYLNMAAVVKLIPIFKNYTVGGAYDSSFCIVHHVLANWDHWVMRCFKFIMLTWSNSVWNTYCLTKIS
jgi:hypothetical protein